ncbi:MAG: hypothetical protein ACJ76N_30550 [Thermoanaerobaculia bacterium]
MSCDRFDAEAVLLLERGLPLDEHFSICPDCLAARSAHDRLRAGIAGLGEEDEPPAGWQARVWERIEQRRERRRSWRQWWWVVPAGAAATLAAFLLVRSPGPRPPSLLAEVQAGDTVRRGSEAQPGDRLRLQATTNGAPYAEMRVYRNDSELVLRCSAERPCTLLLDAIGRYQPLLLLSRKPLPAMASGLETDTRAALAAGAEVQLGPEVTVR